MKPEVEPYFFPLLTYGATLEDYERQEYEFRYELLKEKLLSQQKMNWLRKILRRKPKKDFRYYEQLLIEIRLRDKWRKFTT